MLVEKGKAYVSGTHHCSYNLQSGNVMSSCLVGVLVEDLVGGSIAARAADVLAAVLLLVWFGLILIPRHIVVGV